MALVAHTVPADLQNGNILLLGKVLVGALLQDSVVLAVMKEDEL